MSSSFLVDHAANIANIIAILQSDTVNLWNPANPQNKLRKILFAEPDYAITDDSTPFAYVQWDDQYQSSRDLYGTANMTGVPFLVAYNIVIVVQKKGISQVTSEISRFLKYVIPVLKSYPTLDNPASPGNPLATRMNIVSISRLEQQKGMSKDGAVIKVVYQIGSGWTFQFPAPIGTVNLLSTPVYNDDLDFDIDLMDDMTRTVGPKSLPGQITIEFESTAVIDSQLKTMKDAGVEIPIVLSYGTTFSRNKTVTLTGFHKPVPFDNIERTSVSMEIIQ